MSSSVLGAPPASGRDSSNTTTPWLIALAGLAVMYLPVYWWAANGIWQTEEHGHGPLILAVLVWLFWTLRKPLLQAPTQPAPALGWPLFVLGLLVFVLGRAFNISIFELGSQPSWWPARCCC